MFGAMFNHARDAQEIADNEPARRVLFDGMEHMDELVLQTPFKPGHTPLAVVPNLEHTLFDFYYRGAYDDFWSRACCDQERYFDRHADVPATFSGGWYDPSAIGTTNYFAAMTRQNTTPQRLIMGPWSHGAMRGSGQTWVGDVDFGTEARADANRGPLGRRPRQIELRQRRDWRTFVGARGRPAWCTPLADRTIAAT